MRLLASGILVLILAVMPCVGGDGTSFTFALDRIENRTVHLLAVDGCSWMKKTFGGGSLCVTKNGVAGVGLVKYRSAIVVELAKDGESLEFICAADRCSLTTTDPQGASARQELKRKAKATVSVKTRVVVEVFD